MPCKLSFTYIYHKMLCKLSFTYIYLKMLLWSNYKILIQYLNVHNLVQPKLIATNTSNSSTGLKASHKTYNLM